MHSALRSVFPNPVWSEIDFAISQQVSQQVYLECFFRTEVPTRRVLDLVRQSNVLNFLAKPAPP